MKLNYFLNKLVILVMYQINRLLRPVALLSLVIFAVACNQENEQAKPVAPETNVTPLPDETILFNASAGARGTSKGQVIAIKTLSDVTNVAANKADVTTTLTKVDPFVLPNSKTDYIAWRNAIDTSNNIVQYYGHSWAYGSPQSHLADSGTGGRTINRGPLAAGTFTSNLKYLMPNMTYYVQPYIINYGKPLQAIQGGIAGPNDSGAVSYGPPQSFTTNADVSYPMTYEGSSGTVLLYNADFTDPASGWYTDYDPTTNRYTVPADTLKKQIYLDVTGNIHNQGPGYFVRNIVNGQLQESQITLPAAALSAINPVTDNFEVAFEASLEEGRATAGFEFGTKTNKPADIFRNTINFSYEKYINLHTRHDVTSGTNLATNSSARAPMYNGNLKLGVGEFNTFTIRKYDGYYFYFLNGVLINTRKAYYLDRFGGVFRVTLEGPGTLFVRKLTLSKIN
ncbi:MAG: hypothetical protein V4543_13420 [Bacteroidota bacterium]